MKRIVTLILSVLIFAALMASCDTDPAPVKRTGAPSTVRVIGAATTAVPATAKPTLGSTAAPTTHSAPASTVAPGPSSQVPVSSQVPADSSAAPVTKKPANTGEKPAPIALSLDVKGVRSENGALSVTVDVYLDSYGLTTSHPKSGSVTFNGQTRSFVVDPIDIDDGPRISCLIASETFELTAAPSGEVEVSAEWKFAGTYSGAPVDVLTVTDTVDLGN